MGNCRTRPRRQGCSQSFRNPQSAFRISHRRYRGGERRPKFRVPQSAFPTFVSFVICHLYGYWLLAIGLPALLFQK
jgi:hypothetical protein